MIFVYVDRINNPKSLNNGKWCVNVSNGYMKPMELVYMSKSKRECVEYAKNLSEKPIISNGVEYGAKW